MQRNHKCRILAILTAGVVLSASQAVYGSTILAGTIDGSNTANKVALMPHGAAPTIPERLVIDSPNVSNSGTEAIFNFNPALTSDGTPGYDSSHFFQVNNDQFRIEVDFDLDGSNAHTFHPVNYDGSGSQTTGGIPDTSEDVVWAITGNNGNRTNSILRGSSILDLSFSEVPPDSHVFNISGKLLTDGLFHWYGDVDGDGTYLDDYTSTLASWGLEDFLLFSGSVTNIDDPDSSNFDTYSINDFSVYFVTTAVPTPPSLALMALGVMLIMLTVRLRRSYGG